MLPKIQTFAWRLLRGALATGKRVGKYSKFINSECDICGVVEDEMHIFFLCQNSKAAWFSKPWFIKTEFIAQHNTSVPSIIQFILSSNHPNANLVNLYTFLWSIWKARNDSRFNKRQVHPSQIFVHYNALMKDTSLVRQVNLQGTAN